MATEVTYDFGTNDDNNFAAQFPSAATCSGLAPTFTEVAEWLQVSQSNPSYGHRNGNPVFTFGSKGFDMLFSINNSTLSALGSTNEATLQVGADLGDGANSFKLFGIDGSIPSAYQIIGYDERSAACPGGGYANYALTQIGSAVYTLNTWFWLKIQFDYELNKISIFKNTSTDYDVEPDFWVGLGSFTPSDTLTGSSISALYLLFAKAGSSNTAAMLLGKLILRDRGSNSVGGNITNKSDIQIHKTIGAGSFAKFSAPDSFNTNIATYKNDSKSLITFYENKYSTKMFVGEIDSFQYSTHGGIVSCKSYAAKLRDYRGTNTQIIKEGFLVRVEDESGALALWDEENRPFDNTTQAGKAISFIKLTGKKHVAHCVARDWTKSGTPLTPAFSQGDHDNLYYYNRGSTQTDKHVGAEDTLGSAFDLELTFFAWIKNGSTIDFLNIITQTRYADISFGTNPAIYIYNYTLTSWEKLSDITGAINTVDEDYGTFNGRNVTFENISSLRLTKDGTDGVNSANITDYLDTTGFSNPNAATFNKYRIKIKLSSGQGLIGLPFHRLICDLAKLEFITDTNQSPGDGLGKVAGSGTLSWQLQMDETFSKEIVDLPANAGFSEGDYFVITEFIDEGQDPTNPLTTAGQLRDVFTDSSFLSDLGLSLHVNLTDSDVHAIPKDLSYISLFDYVQEVCNQLNAIWWIEPQTATMYVMSLDNLVDSTITITESDIVGYADNQWVYNYDASVIKSKITVQYNGGSYTASVSPSHAFSAGDEEIIYKRSDIYLYQEAKKFADNMAFYHRFAAEWIQFKIDPYGTANSSDKYASLAVGKIITFDLPNADSRIANWDNDQVTAGVVNVIVAIDVMRNEKTGGKELWDITVQRRRL